MFDLFRPAPISDPELGELRRSRGAWRGTLVLEGRPVPLIVAGPRSGPDPDALRVARTVAAGYPAWRPAIADALLEHCTPYAEAVAEGEDDAPAGGLPTIGNSASVWPLAQAEFVHVHRLERHTTVEIGYRAAWDEEHTLGAQIRDGRLLGLNGSVVAP